MKYCKKCRLLAKAGEEKCRRCGEPVGDMGRPRNAGDHGPALDIQGKMQELSDLERINLRRARLLAGICASVLLAILLTAYQVYARTVLTYALLDDVQIHQDDFEQNRIHVSFHVVKPGKVAFNRTSGEHHTEKVDIFSKPGPVTLSWAWPSPEKVDFRVLYRGGFLRSTQERNFEIDHAARSVDIVFLIDTTRSMQPFIEALKRKCTDFADVVNREGHDCRLGFVSFGDLKLNEPIETLEPTIDVSDFKSRVGRLELTGGGDEPESSVEALQRALKMNFRDSARPCLIHVTDAACHHEEQLPELARRLETDAFITYVVSLEENANLYARLCSNGGQFLPMEDADFDGILDYVARALVSEIKYQEQTL